MDIGVSSNNWHALSMRLFISNCFGVHLKDVEHQATECVDRHRRMVCRIRNANRLIQAAVDVVEESRQAVVAAMALVRAWHVSPCGSTVRPPICSW
jgi:hypothetical protein